MEYYIVVEGKVVGPLTREQLSEYTISANTFIRRSGMDDFKEAHEMEEFRALFGLKKQAIIPQYFASFDQRLLASVIELFLLVILLLFVALASFVFIEAQAQRIVGLIAIAPLAILLKFLYGVFADCSKHQGGIGKRLLNIKVTKLDGTPITFSQSLGRNCAKIISTLPFFLGYLYAFLNKKNQCLHDVVAETLVIKDRLI